MKGEKKHYCYLAGNISGDPETYLWRERFEKEVERREMPLAVLNPCRNKFNEAVRPKKMSRYGGIEKALTHRIGVLPFKDFGHVKICTVMVVNLKLIHPEKPPIGTCFEMEWARQLFIPVIAIVDENTKLGKLYSRHPFTNQCISERVLDEIEAIDVIEEFFIFT